MKKILFMLINMNIGGTEKAFLNMLSEIPLDQYEITVLMLEEYGGFLNQLPKGIKIKYLIEFDQLKFLFNSPGHKVVQKFIRKHNYKEAIKVLLIFILCKLAKERSSLFKYALKNIKELDEIYDLAVAYAGPMDLITYFIAHKVKAKKRIQWIHFDITKIGFNLTFAKKMYKKFDKIFVVSEEGKNKLIKSLPELKIRTEVFYNMVATEIIDKKSKQGTGFEDDYSGIRILTVGRLSYEKGQDRCIEALRRLKKKGYPVRWYVIGDGPYKNIWKQEVEKEELQEDFIFLGARVNPYPYMKECNLYVQPSRHEGYCITLAEARCFNNPIVTTNFTGANEQIINGITGLVVSESGEAIYEGIKLLLNNLTLYNQISENLGQKKSVKSKEIDKLYYMIKS